MPNYSARLKAIEREIERDSAKRQRESLAETIRKAGPVTYKAARFDFGRKAR